MKLLRSKIQHSKRTIKPKKKDGKDETIKEHTLTISIYKVERELDGFYTNPLDLEIKIEKGISKKIPCNSYIIVEAKNHLKLKK